MDKDTSWEGWEIIQTQQWAGQSRSPQSQGKSPPPCVNAELSKVEDLCQGHMSTGQPSGSLPLPSGCLALKEPRPEIQGHTTGGLSPPRLPARARQCLVQAGGLGLGPRTGVGGPSAQASFPRPSWVSYTVTCHSADAWPRFEDAAAHFSHSSPWLPGQSHFCPPTPGGPTGHMPIRRVSEVSSKTVSLGAPQSGDS